MFTRKWVCGFLINYNNSFIFPFNVRLTSFSFGVFRFPWSNCVLSKSHTKSLYSFIHSLFYCRHLSIYVRILLLFNFHLASTPFTDVYFCVLIFAYSFWTWVLLSHGKDTPYSSPMKQILYTNTVRQCYLYASLGVYDNSNCKRQTKFRKVLTPNSRCKQLPAIKK